jgi:hypothetical protein
MEICEVGATLPDEPEIPLPKPTKQNLYATDYGLLGYGTFLVCYVGINVSEEHTASIFKLEE